MANEADKPAEAQVREILERAEVLRQEGKYDEGVSLVSGVLHYGIERAQLYFRLGNLYFDAARYDQAEQAYRRSIDLDPNHVNATFNLGVVFRKQGRIGDALKMRKKANAIARKHPERIKVAPRQIKQLRRVALYWLAFGVSVVIVAVLVLVLIRQLS